MLSAVVRQLGKTWQGDITKKARELALPPNRFIFGEECWASIDNYHMRYLRAGSGPPLILIHGLFGYSFSWRFNLEALSKRFSVLAPDLLGIGYSDRPAAGAVPFDLPQTANRMLHWIAELDLGKVSLVGTSHGGGLALAMAALDVQESRGLIAKLAIVAGVNPWTNRGHRRAKLFSHPVGAFMFKLLAPVMGIARTAMLERMYADPEKITRATRDGYNQVLLLPRTADYGLAIARSWESDLRHLREAVRHISGIPTLIIWGDKDSIIPIESGYKLNNNLKHSRIVIMNGIGHLPYEEAPHEFNEILLGFLNEPHN